MEDTAAMAASLPDDALLEILFHLKEDLAALFRCAMACKHWRGLVADISFLRRCWPGNSFVGFMARERLDEKGTKGIIPIQGMALGRGLRALGSFVPALPAGAVPLVSRHGLLLVRLDSDHTATQLAVCNLHVGTCHVLPPMSSRYLVNYELEVNCYAVLSAADCRAADHDSDKLTPPPPRSHPSSFFKVVIIGCHRGDLKYHLHTLSSHETSWSLHIDFFASDHATFGFFSDVVVRRGTAHWFFGTALNPRFYVANLDTQTGNISLTKLPLPSSFAPRGHYDGNQQCLALVADGEALSLLRMRETGPLIEIWGLQGVQQNVGGAGASEWICTRTMKLKQTGTETWKRELSLLGEKCGTLLVSDNRQCRQCLYTADLETGAMKRVVDWPRRRYINPLEVVTLEMDWAALFLSRLSRLGTRKSRFPLLVFIRGETAPMSRKCRRRRQQVVAASKRKR